MRKIKCFLGNMKKKIVVGATVAAVTVMSAMPVMASDTSSVDSSVITTALETGLNDTANDVLGYIAIALPVGLLVFGAIFGIKKAKAFFSTVAK